MPANIGYTFQPGADAQFPNQQGDGRAPSGLSPQAAVKLLQLRVPERQASSGLAPQGLLTGQGGQGFGGGGLQAIIQMLMSRGFGGQGGGQSLAGGVPTPRVTPGELPMGPKTLDPQWTPEMIQQALNLHVGGGQTLGSGGGILGNWRGQGQSPLPQTQAPPLF